MNEIILLMQGDRRIKWTPGKDSESIAKKWFNDKVIKGDDKGKWVAFKKLKNGTFARMHRFSAKVTQIILVPPIGGG